MVILQGLTRIPTRILKGRINNIVCQSDIFRDIIIHLSEFYQYCLVGDAEDVKDFFVDPNMISIANSFNKATKSRENSRLLQQDMSKLGTAPLYQGKHYTKMRENNISTHKKIEKR